MNLLVTGGTGFIGQYLVEEFLQRGWAVTVIARPGRGKVLRRLEREGTGIRVVEDCAHGTLSPLHSTAFDALVNLVGPGKDSWVTNWQANVEFVRYLTNTLKYLSVGRVIHFSSVAVYGTSKRRRGVVIREEDDLAPDDWYGVTKVLGERIWRQFHEDTGIPVTILRLSWVIGRGSHLLDRHLLAAAKSRVLVKMLPTVPLNAVYVRDVSRAALMATYDGSSGFRVFNINAIDGQRFGDLLEALRTEVPGFKIPLYLPEVALRVLAPRFGTLQFLVSGVLIDAAKAREELGFVPQYDARSSIRELIAAPATASSAFSDGN